MCEQRSHGTKADLEDLRHSVYALRLLTDALADRATKTELAPLVEPIRAAVARIAAILERLDPPPPCDKA